MALFEATRYARGHKALFTLEINGERASAAWDLHDLHRLNYFDHRDEGQLRGWKSIHITDGDHPYMKNWWVPGLQIGYEHTFIHQVADFLVALDEQSRRGPDLPRRIGHRLRNRRSIEIRKDQEMGSSTGRLRISRARFKEEICRLDFVVRTGPCRQVLRSQLLWLRRFYSAFFLA